MTPDGDSLLISGLGDLGVQVTPDQTRQFGHLLALLQEANTRVNLTALKTERDIVLKHFVDSATCLTGGHLDEPVTVIDIGTGAGFPSLPLAILRPHLRITPLDSIRKKVDFVRSAAEALDLVGVTPMVGRAETLGQDSAHRDTYDRVVVRAVAALPVLMELAVPLLKPGGLLVAQKGAITDDELAAGNAAATAVGGDVVDIHSFPLPVLGDARTLVVVRKARPTPARYPRREGVPAQQPLFWRAK